MKASPNVETHLSLEQTNWFAQKPDIVLLKCLHDIYLNPQQSAKSHVFLGRIFLTLDDIRSAENAFENALALQPNDIKILVELGKIKAIKEDSRSLNSMCHSLLEQEKKFHCDEAKRYQQSKQLKNAIDHYHQVLNIDPLCANTYFELGKVYIEMSYLEKYYIGINDHENMTDYFGKTLLLSLYSFYLNPHQPLVHCLLGYIWKEMRNLKLAEKAINNVLALDPNNVVALVNLSGIHLDNDAFDECIALSRKILEINPKVGLAYYNLAGALSRKCLFAEAESALQTALKLLPEHQAAVYGGLASLKLIKNDLEDALQTVDQALLISPTFAPWHFNRSIILLKMGRFLEAWEGFELRFDIPQVRRYGRPDPKIYHTLWQNQDLTSRRLLILADEGRGDTFQNLRYLPLLKQRGAILILQTDTAVLDFLKTLPQLKVSEWVTGNELPPKFDYYVAITSLPHRFQTELHTIPPLQNWRVKPALYPRLPKTGHRLRVGLVWAGDPQHKNNYNRSMALPTLAPLLSRQDICFYSLQYGKRSKDIEACGLEDRIINLALQIQGWKDTAELILELDLVITVDTAVAHCSASLGRPTWIMLPFSADFRWMQDRTDSPWYPTVRLFRQKQPQDWSAVIAEIGLCLG